MPDAVLGISYTQSMLVLVIILPVCFFSPAEWKFHTGKYFTLLFIVASLVPRTVPGIEQAPNHTCQILNGYLFSDRETEAQRGQL